MYFLNKLFFFFVEDFLHWFILVYLFVVLYCYLTEIKCFDKFIYFVGTPVWSWESFYKSLTSVEGWKDTIFSKDWLAIADYVDFKLFLFLSVAIYGIKTIDKIETKKVWSQGEFKFVIFDKSNEIEIDNPHRPDPMDWDQYMDLCLYNANIGEVKAFWNIHSFDSIRYTRFYDDILSHNEYINKLESALYFPGYAESMSLWEYGFSYWTFLVPELDSEKLPIFKGWDEYWDLCTCGKSYMQFLLSEGELNPYDIIAMHQELNLPLWCIYVPHGELLIWINAMQQS